MAHYSEFKTMITVINVDIILFMELHFHKIETSFHLYDFNLLIINTLVYSIVKLLKAPLALVTPCTLVFDR